MEKDKKLVDLEQKPMGRLLAEYSLPAIVGMAAMSFYNIVDSIYIGQCCGAYAITGMGLLFPIMNLLVALGTLVGLGGAATTSITLGQQDFPRAFRVLGHCTIMGFALGVLFGWLPLPWMDEILYLFGADENTVGPARDFMLVLMLTCPLTFSFMNLNHVMRASGYPYKAMNSLLISMVVNIGCAHLFIWVLGWGMTGAALATTAGQAVGMVWVLVHFLNRRSVIHFRGRMWKLCGPIMRRICLLGLPPCLMNLCGCLVVIIFNIKLLPGVIGQIFSDAFNFKAIFGGVAGSCMMYGIKRGLYSNEAGMGSAPNAAASADIDHPVKQGLVQTLSVFIDTLLVCSATAFMCMTSGVTPPTTSAEAASYVQASLSVTLGGVGPIFITAAMGLFAFTTLLGNLFYVDKAINYLLGKEPTKVVRNICYVVASLIIFVGAGLSADMLWNIADVLMGGMTIINIPVILYLGKYAYRALRDYERKSAEGLKMTFCKKDIGLTDETDYWN